MTAKMVCKKCKTNKEIGLFAEGYLTLGKNFMVCSICRGLETESPDEKRERNMEAAQERYKKIIECRGNHPDNKRASSLWNKLDKNNQLNKDLESFTDSEELDGLIESYQDSLIKVISGLEKSMPKWCRIEVEEYDEE